MGLCREAQQPWIPPEAAAAAADQAERQSIWACSTCTLMNAGTAATCKACAQPRPSATQPQAQQNGSPPLSAGDCAAASASSSTADKYKKKKVPKFERLRVTGGDGHATQDWLEANGAVPVRPQNAWTHNRAPADVVARPSVPVSSPRPPPVSNRWAAQPGKLAHQVGAVQQAWAKQ